MGVRGLPVGLQGLIEGDRRVLQKPQEGVSLVYTKGTDALRHAGLRAKVVYSIVRSAPKLCHVQSCALSRTPCLVAHDPKWVALSADRAHFAIGPPQRDWPQ